MAFNIGFYAYAIIGHTQADNLLPQLLLEQFDTIECVNFLTKTECLLSEKDSVKVKLEAFVNPTGKAGGNKAADMQQENNIKMVKKVLRGLGAGKTDKAIERSSKAAPVITSIEENFKNMTQNPSLTDMLKNQWKVMSAYYVSI